MAETVQRGVALARGSPASETLSDHPRALLDIRSVRIAVRLVLVAVFLALWQYASGRWLDPYWISQPSAVFAKLIEWWKSGELISNIQVTILESVVGFICGTVAGGIVGFIFGWFRRVADILDPFIIAIYSLPKVALAPLFIIWFGIGFEMKVMLTSIIVFFLVFFNTYSGVRETSRELIDIVRLMGARMSQVLRWVVLPSALTAIFVGLRVSVPYALIGAVVGEMMASNSGVGFLLMQSAGQFDTAGTFTALLILVAVAMIFNEAIRLAERHLLRWKTVQR